MKYRNGFVSNSSSSSFVAFGKVFKSKEEAVNMFSEDVIKEAIIETSEDDAFYALQDHFYRDRYDLWMAHGSDNGFKDDEYFVGLMVADYIEECESEERMTMGEIIKKLQSLPLRKHLELDECELITGVRSC